MPVTSEVTGSSPALIFRFQRHEMFLLCPLKIFSGIVGSLSEVACLTLDHRAWIYCVWKAVASDLSPILIFLRLYVCKCGLYPRSFLHFFNCWKEWYPGISQQGQCWSYVVLMLGQTTKQRRVNVFDGVAETPIPQWTPGQDEWLMAGPSKHETSTQYQPNVGSPSTTLAQN